VKPALGNRIRTGFYGGVFLPLGFLLGLGGCNNSSTPPPDTTPPSAPAGLTTTVTSDTQINLSWTASTDNVGVTGYKVERCQGANCSNFTQIATPTATTFNDTGLAPSTSYSYRVRATDAAGNLSSYSATSTATSSPDTTPPTAPASLTATAASSTQINLSWTASTDDVGVTGYKVERCSGASCSNFAQIATPTATSYNNTSLTASTSYSYRVRATDAAGNLSSYSGTASATTSAPGPVSVSISPKRAAVTTGQSQQFSATVTGSSNANVTWEVDSVPNGNSTVGMIDGTGKYTPPNTAGVHSVAARSAADTTKTASAPVGVTDLSGVLTWRNDNTRAGANVREFALTTSNVKSATFGKLFSCAIDAPAYSEPLWVANLSIGGGTHNVVIVTTQHNSVYAFDADSSPCTTYWSHVDAGAQAQRLVLSGETFVSWSDVSTDDIFPDIGIVGTPVIDLSTKTIYLVTKSKVSNINPVTDSSVHQRIHALNLTDGSEKFGGPTDIAASVPGIGDGSSGGMVPFSTFRENQRPALTLLNGNVYIAWASHGDNGPYHGWILAYNASNLAQQVAKFNTTPDGVPALGGIWQSGNGLAADAAGYLYCLTGNGAFDGTFPPVAGSDDYGDSALKFSTSSGLALADFFTPFNQSTLNGNDTDLGSGGIVILPDQSAGGHAHLLMNSSKSGTIYLIDRDNMGKFNMTTDQVVQEFNASGGFWSTPAFWQNTAYAGGNGDTIQAWPFNHNTPGQFDATSSSSSPTGYGFPGASPVISASGTANGIVWAIDASAYGQPCCANGPAVLHAYDATNLASELWNSAQGSGNTAGNAVKFTVPTVANGKVYIGTRTELDVYGLLPN
jgi:chitodextrinase